EGDEPEPLAPPEEREELADGTGAAGDVAKGFHVCLSGRGSGLWRIKASITSASRPLRAKVLMASAGVFTIGSPRRLKDVFITTRTPVSCAQRLMSRASA